MANIEEQVITHGQVRKGVTLDNDPYQIGAKCLEPGRIKTFLSNPNLEDESEPLIFFEKVDGKIWGRKICFPTKIKIGENVVDSLGGSSLFVKEEGRKLALGASLIYNPIKTYKNRRMILYAGMTEMSFAIFKKLHFFVFEIPIFVQIRNIKPVLQRLGIVGFTLDFLSFILNPFVKIVARQYTPIRPNHNKEFDIIKLDETPRWVEEIVLKDVHKYSEFHNKDWFDWVLNHNFYNNTSDTRKLYGFYKKNEPIGFVLITERGLAIEERNIDHVVYGEIREWGSIDESILSEYQIYKEALNLFSPQADIVNIVTPNEKTRKKLKFFGFIPHGKDNFAVKSNGVINVENDINSLDCWRYRASYSDKCFY